MKSRRATQQHKSKVVEIKKLKEQKAKPKTKEQRPSQHQLQAVEKRNSTSVQKHIEKLKKAGLKKDKLIQEKKSLDQQRDIFTSPEMKQQMRKQNDKLLKNR